MSFTITKKNCGQILDSDVRYGSLPQCQILPSPSNSFFDSWLSSIPATKMKVSNLFILDKLYKANPKVTPLTYGWLKYTALVNDVIAEEFRKEIGAIPIKGSALDLRIAKASKNYAKVARKIFREKKGTYARAIAQHFFKKVKKVKPLQIQQEMLPRQLLQKCQAQFNQVMQLQKCQD